MRYWKNTEVRGKIMTEVNKVNKVNEVNEVIESYNEYLMKVPTGSLLIANTVREDNKELALQMILEFSEGVSWLVEATQLLSLNNIEVRFEVEKIMEFLEEINSGLEIQDYVLVADLFEYEIAPFFEEVEPISNLM